jgi:hypothetical protein
MAAAPRAIARARRAPWLWLQKRAARKEIAMASLRQASGHGVAVADGADERLVAYALAVEAIFADLRAIIGQLSGMFILLQTRRTHDLGELPALVRDRRDRAVERIGRLNSPDRRLADRSKLTQAVDHIDAAMVALRNMRHGRSHEQIASASGRLRAAYQLMQDVCDHRIGLTMVDTRNACCACGKKLA